MKWLVVQFTTCKKNSEMCRLVFPEMMSSDVSFCPQPKDIQLTVAEEWRDRNMLKFKKLESDNF